MLSNTTEHAAVGATSAQGTTLTIDRGPVSLRKLYLPNVAEAEAAYDLATAVARKRRSANFGAALHLATLARLDLNECVERAVARGGLLHINAPGLPA